MEIGDVRILWSTFIMVSFDIGSLFRVVTVQLLGKG